MPGRSHHIRKRGSLGTAKAGPDFGEGQADRVEPQHGLPEQSGSLFGQSISWRRTLPPARLRSRPSPQRHYRRRCVYQQMHNHFANERKRVLRADRKCFRHADSMLRRFLDWSASM